MFLEPSPKQGKWSIWMSWILQLEWDLNVHHQNLCASLGDLLELTVFLGKREAEALFALGFSAVRSCINAADSPELFSSVLAQPDPIVSPSGIVHSQSRGGSLSREPVSAFATLQLCFPY